METRRKATKATAAKSARQARRRAHSFVAPMRQRRHPEGSVGVSNSHLVPRDEVILSLFYKRYVYY